MPKMALEVLAVEAVGSCFMIKMRDARGDQINATFHESAKERIQKEVRKHRVIVLKNIG